MRIASYNILSGGRGRLKYIAKAIKEINPDICGILEAVGWQNKKDYYKKFAENSGYHFFYLAIANSKYNIAVFSKIPLQIKTIKKGIRHVVVEAVIKKGQFKGFSIFFVHLSPISENARLLEFKELLKYINKSKNAIIIGDFNSLSANDPYDKRNLLKIFQKNNIVKFGADKLRFDVIKKIESAELMDAVKYLKATFIVTTPTLSNKDINHIANIRIDYAFLTKNILKYLKKMEVFKNSVADKASDHYPLYIELLR
jgi:endonuclease/exonuclease/phosphatase family metal-dependent hydrolase